MSFIDLREARGLDIPTPGADDEFTLPLRGSTGEAEVRVRPGRVRVWWTPDCLGTPFDWLVLFRVRGAAPATSVLGLGGVIADCRWTFDGTISAARPFGSFLCEDIR